MLSAICFNLVQSKILSSGNGLIKHTYTHRLTNKRAEMKEFLSQETLMRGHKSKYLEHEVSQNWWRRTSF